MALLRIRKIGDGMHGVPHPEEARSAVSKDARCLSRSSYDAAMTNRWNRRATIAAGERHGGEIDMRRDRGLAAGRIVDLVVEQEMDEVARRIGADRRQRAELHQSGAVAVDDDDLALRVEGDAEPHAARAPHRADLVEMLLAVGQGEELAPGLAGGGDDRRRS